MSSLRSDLPLLHLETIVYYQYELDLFGSTGFDTCEIGGEGGRLVFCFRIGVCPSFCLAITLDLWGGGGGEFAFLVGGRGGRGGEGGGGQTGVGSVAKGEGDEGDGYGLDEG
jgi:hypothetical protein